MSPSRATPAIDRSPQNLPVPLGDMAPVRIAGRTRARRMRFEVTSLLAGVGALCGVFGLVLLLAPPPVAVSLLGDHLRVGAMVLTAASEATTSQPVLFQGGASYALIERRDGTASAAASWVSGGTISSGVCRLHHDGDRLIDECSFRSGVAVVTCVDVLDPAAGPQWQRTYADGAHATIDVPPDGSAVPVAFPIGR